MTGASSKAEIPVSNRDQRADSPRHIATADRPNLLKAGAVLQSRYQIHNVLGVGGMSTVYRARDLRFAGVERWCAVKEMFNLGDDPKLRQLRLTNFQREAAMLATLSHAAIPRIHDFFDHQASINLVLELISGQDLETLLTQRGDPFTEQQLITWAIELCDVLEYLHGHDPEPIIFRDLKPSNIMIRNTGALTLVDFGIARSFVPLEKGTMIGTEGYAPPEQYRGTADARGDIYALGATLHHLATGSDPRTETPFTFAQRPPRRLNAKISAEFEELILKAVSYTPQDRYASVSELKTAIVAIRDLATHSGIARAGAERTTAYGSKLLAPPASTERAADAAPSADDRVSWIVSTGDEVRGSAAHAGGAVYVGSYDSHMYAIDDTDGTIRWRFRAQRGIVSRPLPAAELLIFGSEDTSVYALSRQQGRSVWSFRTAMAVRSSPSLSERSCFVGSDDGFLYCLDRARGSVSWRYRTWGPIRATPLVVDRKVIFGSDDGYLYCIDRDGGQLNWRTNVGAPMVDSAALVGSTIVVGGLDGQLRGFSVENGKVSWQLVTGKAIIASPVWVDQTVYVGSADGSFYALEAESGELSWKQPLCRQITSTAAIDGESLYIGGTDGRLYCLNRAGGEVRWFFHADGPIVARPLVTAEHVVVGSLDGKVYALHRET